LTVIEQDFASGKDLGHSGGDESAAFVVKAYAHANLEINDKEQD